MTTKPKATRGWAVYQDGRFQKFTTRRPRHYTFWRVVKVSTKKNKRGACWYRFDIVPAKISPLTKAKKERKK